MFRFLHGTHKIVCIIIFVAHVQRIHFSNKIQKEKWVETIRIDGARAYVVHLRMCWSHLLSRSFPYAVDAGGYGNIRLVSSRSVSILLQMCVCVRTLCIFV